MITGGQENEAPKNDCQMKHRRALSNEAPKMDCHVSRTAYPLARLRLLMILQ